MFTCDVNRYNPLQVNRLSGKGGDRILLTIEGGDALKIRLSMKGDVVRFFALLHEASQGKDQ